ncbi:hypothetical protein [Neisseria weixii]|uniref:hypothetical protein n=1 Tax=Neisseria weixii TaxID=1853276 RepID=UPI0012FE45B6|nr:hypothetical protein [Neisseria weixii]
MASEPFELFPAIVAIEFAVEITPDAVDKILPASPLLTASPKLVKAPYILVAPPPICVIACADCFAILKIFI